MGTYKKEWDCCGSVTETESWEPENCPFCTDDAAALRKDAERYRKLVACGKYAAASIGGGWGLAHSGVHTGRSSKAELDAAADALPAVGAA